MKNIELHQANRFHKNGVTYLKGQVYNVSNQLADELLAAKNTRGVPYFRVPLTEAQKKEIAEREKELLTRDMDGHIMGRANDGRNIVRVEDVVDEKPAKAPAKAAPAKAAPASDEEEEGGVSV